MRVLLQQQDQKKTTVLNSRGTTPSLTAKPTTTVTTTTSVNTQAMCNVKSIEMRCSEFEKSLQDVKESNRKLVESHAEINETVEELTGRVDKLEAEIKSNKEQRAQWRRISLRIHGLPEDGEETSEETEGRIREYISKDLDLEHANISIERAHRIHSTEKPRPARVKFSSFKDKERVLKSYVDKRKMFNEREKQRKKTSGDSKESNHDELDVSDDSFRKEITISEDFPSDVMKVRKELRRFLRDALKGIQKAFLKYDKLVIESDTYEYDSDLEDTGLEDK